MQFIVRLIYNAINASVIENNCDVIKKRYLFEKYRFNLT